MVGWGRRNLRLQEGGSGRVEWCCAHGARVAYPRYIGSGLVVSLWLAGGDSDYDYDYDSDYDYWVR
jgi:hypothetical protein